MGSLEGGFFCVGSSCNAGIDDERQEEGSREERHHEIRME